ncbi:unnamed protein product [Discula destructiva]
MPEGSKSSLNPDWVIIDHAITLKYHEDHHKQTEKPLVYVAGDSKVRQKWKSGWLESPGDLTVNVDSPFRKQPHQATKVVTQERLAPLRQIETYCRYAATRYAYIVTKTELVVLRVRRIIRAKREKKILQKLRRRETEDEKIHAAIEYKSMIPWEGTSADGLTVNLAVWALGCMAMNEQERAMERPIGGTDREQLSVMARLTRWKESADGSAYENVISKRQIPRRLWKKEWNVAVVVDNDGHQGGNSEMSAFGGLGPVPTTPGSNESGGPSRSGS